MGKPLKSSDNSVLKNASIGYAGRKVVSISAVVQLAAFAQYQTRKFAADVL